MADIVSRKKRSLMMAGIKGKNTKPEIIVRKALFALGYRYKLHNGKLPGRPDIVLKKYNAVIFVQGCFWHGHENCHLFRLPKSRQTFWKNKIEGNITRDRKNLLLLQQAGWRICNIWECSVKNRSPDEINAVVARLSGWLAGNRKFLEIRSATG